ncbi:MAG: DnaD domain-containing protein [Clostridium sp.]
MAPLAPAEREIIDTWSDYGFSDEIIEQACKRTVLQTGGTNLNYITSILKDWHKKGVLTLADIEKCDKSFQQKKKTGEQKNSATQQKKKPIPEFSSKRVFQRGLQFTGKTVTAQCAGIKQTKGFIYYAFDQQSVRASDVPLLSSAAQGQFHPEKAHEGSL